VNQEDSEQNEVDGMKKRVDSTDEMRHNQYTKEQNGMTTILCQRIRNTLARGAKCMLTSCARLIQADNFRRSYVLWNFQETCTYVSNRRLWQRFYSTVTIVKITCPPF